MSEERRILLVTEVDSTGAREGLNEISQEAGRMAGAVQRSGERAERAVREVGAGANQSAARVEAAQRNLIGSIQRTTAQMEAGTRTSSRYFEVLAQQRGVNPAVLEPYLRQLRAVEQAQQRAGGAAAGAAGSLDRMGASAGQTANALRQVPAQLTDIITSLQGGQGPLTVLLQQGGQLRDSFGSVGGAIRGVGSQLLGLINPYTAVAAVALGLGVAYNEGAKEARAYNTAIAATGNISGTSAGQLADAARQVSSFVGSQREASAVIAELTATGRIANENIALLAVAATRAQRDLGREVKTTVEEFAALGKTPSEALRELAEKYRGITAATYDQVRALEQQGRATDAATLAQQAHAESIERQRQRVLDSLTDWERGWIRIKTAISGAADGVSNWLLNIGRQSTAQQKINGGLAEREKLEANLLLAQQRGDMWLVRRTQAALEQNKAEINAARDRLKAEKDRAAEEGKAAQREQEMLRIRSQKDSLLSREKQRENELAATRQRSIDLNLSAADAETALALVRKKYNDLDEAAKREREAAAKRAAEQLKKEAAVTAELAGLTASFAEDWKLLSTQYAKGAISLEQLTASQAKLLAKQPAMKEAAEREAEANKRLAESAASYAKGLADAAEQLRGFQEQVRGQKESNEQIGLTGAALADLTAVRLEATAAQKEESAAAIEAIEPGSALAESYRAQAQALRDLAEAKRDGVIKQASVDSAKQFAEEWKKASEQIGQSLADNIMRGGKSAAEYIKDLFRTMILRPVIQAVTQPVANQVTGFLQGGSSGGGAGNLFSAGQSIYSGFSSGLSSSMGGIITRFGEMFGSTAMSSFGQGMGMSQWAAARMGGGAFSAGSSAASAVPVVGWIAAGMAAANSLYKQGWDAQNGSLTDSLGGKAIMPFNAPMLHLNTALQKIGLSNSLANMLSGASTVSKLFGRKNPEIESQGLQGTVTASGFDGNAYANILEKGGIFRSDKRYTQTAALGADQDKSLDESVKAIIEAAKGFASTLGLEASVIEGYNKQIKLELGKDEAKNQEAIAKLFGEIGDDLSTRLVPSIKEFSAAGETASATLQRLVTNYATVDEALKSIGTQFGAVGVASLSARERLIEASGGLEAFAANTAGFQQNFLTESERLAPVIKSVTEQLASMGLSAVDSRDEFKQVVLGLDLTTEAGAKQYGALMKLQAAFALVYPQIEDTAAAAKAAADALAATNKGYQDQIDELLKARMPPDERRTAEIAGMDASTVALYDRVMALQKEASVLEERKGLQSELDSLTLTAAEKLQQQRDALDDSNKAIFDQINAVKAQATAAEQAAAAQERAAQVIRDAQDKATQTIRSFGDAIMNAITQATEGAKALREFNDSLLLGNLSTLDPDQKYREAKRLFEASAAGDTQAAQAFLQASKDRGADSAYYERDFAKVRQRLEGAAKALDDRAAMLPGFYLGYAQAVNPALAITNPQPTPPAPSPAISATGTMSKESASKAENEALRSEVKEMRVQLGEALSSIANSTAKTAEYIDRVTEGGNAMVVAN